MASQTVEKTKHQEVSFGGAQVINTEKDEKNKQPKDVIGCILRGVIILSLICLFIPALNPARMSELISSNSSFFTSGISYGGLTEGFTRAFRKGYIESSVLTVTYVGALVSLIGFIATAVGCAMTLGEVKLKRLGSKVILGGSAVGLIGMIVLSIQYSRFCNCAKPERIKPIFPIGIIVFFAALGLIALLAAFYLLRLPKAKAEEKYTMETKYRLFLMMIPFIILTFLFSYLPLWGWRYAFFDYTAGQELSMDKFVGFKWFTYLFENSATRADMSRVIINTLAISGLGLLTSILPMIFAIFLSEIKCGPLRRSIQTITTIPNFISWVLVYTVAFALFSSEGLVNTFLMNTGLANERIDFLMGNSHIWLKMLAWNLWKGLGWSAIIYIAGISGIDQQLYEAATIDGAGRFQKMIHVTVPGLMTTFFVLLLMAIANILSNGMDQYLVFSNPTNKASIEVLDLYVYNLGLKSGQVPLSTVVGIAKSIISVTLLFTANKASKAIRGESIV